MSIVSLTFYIFIGLTLILYYVFPQKHRWVVLLVASMFFYAFSGFQNLLYLCTTVVSSYFVASALSRLNVQQKALSKEELGAALFLQKKRKLQNQKRILLSAGLGINLGLLIFIKVIGFLKTECAVAFNPDFLGWVAPLGISFYTFIVSGFLVDCFWGKCAPQNNFFKHVLFVSYFPQMVQGPINSYRHMSDSLLREHTFDVQTILTGFLRMLFGLFKKLVIAERAVLFVDSVYNTAEAQPGCIILISVILYLFQLYADFSGGIDIVMGVSQMFDISMNENFRQPLYSRSLSDFWNRWHITLGTWMKTYVFNPLAFSKPFQNMGRRLKRHFGVYVSRSLPTGIALFVTFLLVGIWHGVNLKYIAFGMVNGTIILFSTLMEQKYSTVKKKMCINDTSKVWYAFQTLRTFIILLFLFCLLRSDTLTQCVVCLRNIFLDFNLSMLMSCILECGLDAADLLVLGIAIVFLLGIDWYDYLHSRKTLYQSIGSGKPFWRSVIIFVALFVLLIFGCYGPNYNGSNFLYQMF